MLNAELTLEAHAFDDQILERIAHGHIPDLRRTEPCDWFRNNVWRRPYLVRILYGRVVQFCLQHITRRNARVLEVGCGPGFMSLELARHGHHVTGIDVSKTALEVAEQMAQQNPFTEQFGSVAYQQADFLDPSEQFGDSYDAILFFGSLHHFRDPAAALAAATERLVPTGRILVYEPTRDNWSLKESLLLGFLRTLLSATGHWFETLELPADTPAMRGLAHQCLDEIRTARTSDEELQSVMDNATDGEKMLRALHQRFRVIAHEHDTLLFDRLAAGIRGVSEERAEQIALLIRSFEQTALELNLLQPGGMLLAAERL